MKSRAQQEEGATLQPVYAAALRHDVLTKDGEHALCTKLAKLRRKHGATHPKTLAARNQLVRANLRAVAKLAKRFKALPFEDLMSEGVKGLIVAAEKFEVERGWRFGTYATYWVRHALQRACMDTGDIVRVPVHQQEGRKGSGQIDGVRLLGARPMSLDAALDVDGGRLYDVLPAETAQVVDSLCALKLSRDLRRVVMQTLSAREQEVIARRFLNDSDETLSEVGTHVGGVTRERVRQIQGIALDKLRKACERAGLSAEACL